MHEPSNPGLAYRLAALARKPGMHVYICRDLRRYRQLAEELAFFMQGCPQRLWRFPAWEVLPYDRVSPHRAIVGERFTCLSRLLNEPAPAGLLLTALPAWLQRITPPEAVAAHVWRLHGGQSLDIGRLKQQLALAGMQPVERVLDQGEFAARGGLLDVWPPTEEAPLRLDLFGDEIESIRRFDVESQRSGEALDQFISVPVREVILDEPGRERFAAAFRARFPHLRSHPLLKAVQDGRPHPGIESLLPLAYERTVRLTDYLPGTAHILGEDGLDAARERFAEQVRDQFALMRAGGEPLVAPQELFAIETPLTAAALPPCPDVQPAPSLADFQGQPRALHHLLQLLRRRMREGWRLLLVAHGPGQLDGMLEACGDLGHPLASCQGLHDMNEASMATAIGFVDSGFALATSRLLLLTGRELLGQRLPRRRAKGAGLRADVFASLAHINIGDAVVHEDHGIGRYLGLVSLEAGGIVSDFLHVEYANEASIYLPVEELDRLHRYGGEEAPPLDKLGGERWKKTRERVRRDVLAMAHEVVAVEAGRRRHTRPPYLLGGDARQAYEEFAARFPFEETDEQHDAIEATLADLAGDKPMDRVICGDVGFGKTEVAMRAAFVVANAGRQVALLAPTTVLANQHYATLRERFAATGLEVAVLTRMQGKAAVERLCHRLQKGGIDILVGTHRLLADDVRFARLGLVIVDEEHRFGVKQKEKLKALHHGIDLLTLSATPIPRTLHQSLSGLRPVSIISTPPAEREAIRTLVSPFSEALAREAIRREMFRGGQIYYVHNHVGSIDRIARRLAETIPEADIGIAHGKMAANQLDKQMLAFYEGRLNILVCTTIIESGLDVPNANTLIVERADLMGLAQLHQIRGRVGRSHHQAYAYLFTPEPRAMTPQARERLAALAEHSELGAGFWLARQDMEIRGAGNLLGAEQSGHIEAIGLDLYLDMLAEAIAEAQGKPPMAHAPVQVHMHVNAILPPDYIPQLGERLQLYRRIARTGDDGEIKALREEIADRFGGLPEETRYCLDIARIRWRARALGLSKLEAGPKAMRLVFSADSKINTSRLLARVQAEPKRFRLKPDGSLTVLAELADADQRIHTAIAFLDKLLADSGAC